MSEDAHEALPRFTLLVPQGPAEIGQDDQLMGQPSLAKSSTAHAPAAEATGQRDLHGARRFAMETVRQPEFGSGAGQQLFAGTCQQAFAGAVDEAESLVCIESKYRDFK